MAIRRGLPDWMKWTLGLGALVVVLAVGAMTFGHNPMQHMMGHGG